ncbi:MAG: hypothetical protein APR53_08185 [Methanoculleus sp. SDB]|nr:MAG: hypothetical protein APR53_08185 [Methanoculleus sp. SDB]
MPDDHRSASRVSAIVGRGVSFGLIGGIIFLSVTEALSRGWNGAFAYNQNLAGIGITQVFVSEMLVLFLAGFFAAYSIETPRRRTRILSAALAGAVAAITARSLLFIPDPLYLVHSLITTWLQVLLFVSGAVLVAGIGGIVAYFLEKEESGGYRGLLPVAAVAVAIITVPPLLAIGGIAAGAIPPAPYSGGAPAQETDTWVLKVSAGGEFEWEARADIDAYDQPDILVECRDGFALAATEYGQEQNTAHIILYDDGGNIQSHSTVATGYGRMTALVPRINGGFAIASENPEILRVDAAGEVLWKQSLVNESRGMASVSLLALDDNRYVAVWEEQAACMNDNGTMVWQTPLGAVGGIGYHPVYPAPEGGVLVFSEGRNVFVGDHFEVYLQAIRLDRNGTVLWRRDFGSGGLDELLGAWETVPGRFSILYRSTTFPKDFRGKVVPAYNGYFFILDENGDLMEFHAVEDDGETVIPSSGGYLSVIAGDTDITLVCRDITGNLIWQRQQEIRTNRHSIRGIGTADGGYLIAGSTAA